MTSPLADTDFPAVIALNLTDLGPDGNPDPLSEIILELAVTAAKVANSPDDLMAARVSLLALRDSVAADLAYFPQLLDAVQMLLVSAQDLLGVTDG